MLRDGHSQRHQSRGIAVRHVGRLHRPRVAGHQPGREILYPVATVILGGLVTSTFCEFLIHPGLFWRFSGKAAGRLAGQGADAAEEI